MELKEKFNDVMFNHRHGYDSAKDCVKISEDYVTNAFRWYFDISDIDGYKTPEELLQLYNEHLKTNEKAF